MNDYINEHKYDDILSMPHHVSSTRSHMSMHDRARSFHLLLLLLDTTTLLRKLHV